MDRMIFTDFAKIVLRHLDLLYEGKKMETLISMKR